MAYYNICEKCGSTLDPSERCNCREEIDTAPAAKEEQEPVSQETAQEFIHGFLNRFSNVRSW